MHHKDRKIQLWWLPAACVMIPAVATHLSWLISTYFQIIDPCLPYWADCVSISRTARHLPAALVFKGLMIPYAVLMVFLWFLVREWLVVLGITGKSLNALLALGITSGLFLIVYLVALGVDGEQYRLARRSGVIISFGFTYLAQLLLLLKLAKSKKLYPVLLWIIKCQKIICFMLLFIGISSIILDLLLPDYRRWQNAVEWWFAIHLYVFFITIASAWKKTGFAVSFNNRKFDILK